jgi:hypothetical protein
MTEHKIDGKVVETCNLKEGQLCMYQGCWKEDPQIYCMITSFTPKCGGRKEVT